MKLRILLAVLVLPLAFVSCGLSQEKKSPNTNMNKENAQTNQSSNDEFKNLLFADQSLEEIAANFKIESTPAKDNFAHYFALALDNVHKGKTEEAKKNLKYTLTIPNVETRVQLWAWKALRQLGEKTTANEALEVRGVVIEVPMENGYDILAVYPDGQVRYINYTGKIAVWDAPDDRFKSSINNILESAKPFVNKTSASEKHKAVKSGFVQISILTFGGIYQTEAKLEDINENSPLYPFLANGGQIIGGLAEVAK